MNREEAIDFVRYLIFTKIGKGYHPDNSMLDYVDANDKPSFSKKEARELEAKHAEAWEALNSDIYSIALEMVEKDKEDVQTYKVKANDYDVRAMLRDDVVIAYRFEVENGEVYFVVTTKYPMDHWFA